MQKICSNTWCGKGYEVTGEDLAFLEKISPIFHGKKELMSPPTLCPPCRQQKRIAWRNERAIYMRSCDLCKKQGMSMYAPSSSSIVYCPSCFWSDAWQDGSEGRAFDETKTFAEQFEVLQKESPLLGLINMNTENSDYCNRIYDGRNNYLSFIILFGSEDCLYSFYTQTCKDVCDTAINQHTQCCYELTDGEKCYECFFSSRLRNCNDCWFSEDCAGCTSCFQCKNLHQKTYCIRNKQYSKEDYLTFIQSQDLGSHASVEKCRSEAKDFFLTLPYRALMKINCENCTGTNIFHCKDCTNVYDFFESERMTNCTWGEKSHDCMDCFGFGFGSFNYECANFNYANQDMFCIDCPNSSDLLYCTNMFNECHHCFGCIGLKKRSYRILNKQYTQEEYETLMPRIIDHMRKTGEWGQFFPKSICPFGYNETVAQEYFPQTQENATANGFLWRAKDPKEYLPATHSVVNHINDVQDDILSEILGCETCGKNYKIVAKELAFYRRFSLPLPHLCPDCRHARRMGSRPKRQLCTRKCGKCSVDTLTSYEAGSPEIIYCESCYLATVY